jgi:hypothetical protein
MPGLPDLKIYCKNVTAAVNFTAAVTDIKIAGMHAADGSVS